MDSRGLHTPLTIEELEAELEAGAHGEPGRPPEASPDGARSGTTWRRWRRSTKWSSTRTPTASWPWPRTPSSCSR
ncbi:hypothetical protein ANANG_G00311040 [Anguilla anguilla]|uniref:Uncharacterized protein n=1 Tax=Anguilla anguilla TaxID=7936 RepID=A0A9D3LH55_ANGAN|nr:hypothetical protein ANANG_G00311040 [Anguilla anguilla]